MVISEKLGKFVWEVKDLPIEEYEMWLAYFNIQQQQQKAASRKQNRPKRRQPIEPRGQPNNTDIK
jgi:hypothetical protein